MKSDPLQTVSAANARPKRWVQRFVLLVSSFVFAAVLADFAVRLLGLGPTAYDPRRYEPDGRVPFAQIPNGPITYQPNARFASIYDSRVSAPYTGGRVEYVINSFGFCGPETTIEKKPGTIRISCLGDSFTFGEGVREEATWPQKLEAMLNEKELRKAHGSEIESDTRYEVLNCGVQGHGTVDEFLYYRMYVSQFKPDIVIVAFFLNDAMKGTETIRQNEEWTRTRKVSVFAQWSRIAEILERRSMADELQESYFAAIRESFDSTQWGLCQSALADLKSLTAANGARLIVAVWPVLWKLDSEYPFEDIHQKIAAFCKSGQIECVDLLDTFRGSQDYKFWVHPTDHHPNVLAHGSAAYHLYEYLETRQNN